MEQSAAPNGPGNDPFGRLLFIDLSSAIRARYILKNILISFIPWYVFYVHSQYSFMYAVIFLIYHDMSLYTVSTISYLYTVIFIYLYSYTSFIPWCIFYIHSKYSFYKYTIQLYSCIFKVFFLHLFFFKLWPNPIFLHSAHPLGLGNLGRSPLGLELR